MSGKIFTPVNQVRFTNVAVVRLKRAGKRFEIACYKNKVVEWRKKITTNLDEVLQSPTIFENVSKGQAAKIQDLKKAFKTTDDAEIAKIILDKGEIQVSGEERKHQLDSMFRDVATIVAEKCVNPETGRPLTVGLVERAMRDIHYSVNPTKNAKSQALDVIKKLQEKPDFPIARAPMRLKLVLPLAEGENVKQQLLESTGEEEGQALLKTLEKEETREEEGKYEMVILIDPANYRPVNDAVKKVKGTSEVLNMTVTSEGDQHIE
ncbi:Ribosome maturation protein SBDS [Balamuthia mandrillaris]